VLLVDARKQIRNGDAVEIKIAAEERYVAFVEFIYNVGINLICALNAKADSALDFTKDWTARPIRLRAILGVPRGRKREYKTN
jgi:hypothetical protein